MDYATERPWGSIITEDGLDRFYEQLTNLNTGKTEADRGLILTLL